LVDTIKSLQRDVLTYKDDNEKLIKAQAHQNGFNIKLFQILDKIEKKLDKETFSSKSKDNISHAKKEESKSVGKHHNHSPETQLEENIIV